MNEAGLEELDWGLEDAGFDEGGDLVGWEDSEVVGVGFAYALDIVGRDERCRAFFAVQKCNLFE
jgi:hypothetical protein